MSGSPSPVPVVVTTHLAGTDWWPNLLQGSVGSVVGTLLAVGGSVWLALHIAGQDRQAAKLADRAAIGVQAATRLLQLLADLESDWRYIDHTAEREGQRGFDAAQRVRRASLADVPLLHVTEARTAIDNLAGLVRSLRHNFVLPTGLAIDAARQMRLQQFLAYEAYCRELLIALIDDRPGPPYAQPPILTGEALKEPWLAPDVPPA